MSIFSKLILISGPAVEKRLLQATYLRLMSKLYVAFPKNIWMSWLGLSFTLELKHSNVLT